MEKKLTFEQAKDKALRLIEFRSHSEKELREKLKHAGAEAEDIDSVVEFLLHYLTRPTYHIHVREALYLDNTLDLF